MKLFSAFVLVTSAFVFTVPAFCQDAAEPGPQLPVILEWADSLVGTGSSDSVTREFIGNVRFRQGNVTVKCDRAVHYSAANAADLFGNVVVTQDSLTMRAPYAHYDGNRFHARATRGVVVIDGHHRLEARQGFYSTKTHIAEFDGNVIVHDDTMTVWSDQAQYERDTKLNRAIGNVLLIDTTRRVILRGDTLYHAPSKKYSRIAGEAMSWRWEADEDTVYLSADTIQSFQEGGERYIAEGNVAFVRGSVAARADSMAFDESTGDISLFGQPILWADSSQLLGDTIFLEAPQQKLRSVRGVNNAIMMSINDSLARDRVDQVTGRLVTLFVSQDTVRSLISIDDARSITFRSEEGTRDGLAKFAADTIKAFFVGGQPQDIYWLGGVEGEHHPEPVVAGHEASYRLPGFDWRQDRPESVSPPKPFASVTARPQRLPRASTEGTATTGKKK